LLFDLTYLWIPLFSFVFSGARCRDQLGIDDRFILRGHAPPHGVSLERSKVDGRGEDVPVAISVLTWMIVSSGFLALPQTSNAHIIHVEPIKSQPLHQIY
jgi:hypothetical protein